MISDSTMKKWLWVHFLLCSLGLIKLTMAVAGGFYYSQFLDFAISKLGSSVLEDGIGKFGMILQYFFSLAVLLLFFGLVWTLISKNKIREISFVRNKIFIAVYFLLNSIFMYRMGVACASFLHWIIPWLFFTVGFPACCFAISMKKWPVISKSVCIIFLTALFAQLWLIFQPLIVKPMLIENDYMDISGQTFLKNEGWVDNTNFINQHNIGGIVKYDPRKDNGQTPLPPPETYVTIDAAPLLLKLLDINLKTAKYRYTYYPHTHYLALKGVMTEDEHHLLRYAMTNPRDLQQIDKLYFLSLQQKEFYNHRVYTPAEWEFIQKNRMELIDQARTGWFFYHHNYFFSPILAAALDGRSAEQTTVYGWLNTQIFAKVLTLMGGVNYQNYFHLFFLIYPLYYICFFTVLLLLFRRIEYALLGMLLAITALFAIGIEPLRLAPGFNPMRHFLDVFVFLSFYVYVKKRHWIALGVTYAFSFLMLLGNKEFGLFLLVSVTAAILIYEGLEKKRFSASMGFALLSSIIGLFLYSWIPGKNPGFAYVLLGQGCPTTPPGLVRDVLAINAILYFFAILFYRLKDPLHYFWLSVIFYCQLSLLYVLWFPAAHHFYNLAVPLAFLLLSFIYLCIRYFRFESNERHVLSGLVAVLFLAYVPTAISFYQDEHQYYRNFATHKIYQWPFETARLVSTMDPQLFVNAVSLIQQYAPEHSIYIISRYDDLLPALAGKYTAMPYNELLTNLLTSNDVTHVADVMKQKKPHYIFVDTDIARSFNNEIYHPDDVLAKRYQLNMYSRDRVSTLNNIKLLYDRIRGDYKVAAKSELITVYERIS